MVQTNDRGYALAGVTLSSSGYDADFWLVKTDESGNTQWNETYGGTSIDEVDSLIQTKDEGYLLAGFSQSFGAGSSQSFGGVYLVRTDPSGNVQWSETYRGTSLSGWIRYSVIQTNDGGYALAGAFWSPRTGSDFWLVKMESEQHIIPEPFWKQLWFWVLIAIATTVFVLMVIILRRRRRLLPPPTVSSARAFL
jgi:hypothetical protein